MKKNEALSVSVGNYIGCGQEQDRRGIICRNTQGCKHLIQTDRYWGYCELERIEVVIDNGILRCRHLVEETQGCILPESQSSQREKAIGHLDAHGFFDE